MLTFTSLEFYAISISFYPFWGLRTKAEELFCPLVGLCAESANAPLLKKFWTLRGTAGSLRHSVLLPAPAPQKVTCPLLPERSQRGL